MPVGTNRIGNILYAPVLWHHGKGRDVFARRDLEEYPYPLWLPLRNYQGLPWLFYVYRLPFFLAANDFRKIGRQPGDVYLKSPTLPQEKTDAISVL